MNTLIEKSQQRIALTSTHFVRSIMNDIVWESRLIGIKGARGVGKTTLLLQYIKLHLADQMESTLYLSMDAVWFTGLSLREIIEEFARKGGKYLFLDEIHKEPEWSRILKNAYDDYPQIKIVFTGSSALEILNARADLSRRAVIYSMQGFSFREFLSMETGNTFEVIDLAQLLQTHTIWSRKILDTVKPLQYFEKYLKIGYYPFYLEQPVLYDMKLREIINMIMEIELPLLRSIDLAYVPKLKQLLTIIASSVPFIPNTSKISQKININRTTLLHYFHYLDEIGLTLNLYKDTQGISKLQKPNKIYLENTNLMYVLTPQEVNKGSIRETFFANQLRYKHAVMYSEHGDFHVDHEYFFEIGGRNKPQKQIENLPNAYIVCDDIEYGFQNRIPLWLFGFLY